MAANQRPPPFGEGDGQTKHISGRDSFDKPQARRVVKTRWPPNVRASEVHKLRRWRVNAAVSVADLDDAYDNGDARHMSGHELGIIIRFSFAEFKGIGQETGRHFSTIQPYDVTKLRKQEYLKEINRKRRREAERQRRAEKRAKAKLAGELVCRRGAVFSILSPTRYTTNRQIAHDLAQCPGFRRPDGRQLTGKSLTKAVQRVLDALEFESRVDKEHRDEKHGCRTYAYRLRPIRKRPIP